jgi:two-component system chemotaxis response regulator CheB
MSMGLWDHSDSCVLCISFSQNAVRILGLPPNQSAVELPYAIAIGASAGGVSALLELVAALPPGLPAIVGVVLHVGSQASIVPELLTSRGPLRAAHPHQGQALVPGAIYFAPPDQHMLFTPDGVQLLRGPRENHARPAVDPLFRSVAVHWRDRAIGVVLTGNLDDGTAGLAAIKGCGGTAIVQDPATAIQPSMPASAMASVAVDHCLPLAGIAPVLVRQVALARPVGHPVPETLLHEEAVFKGNKPMENLEAVATPSALTCPDCGGSLWELNEVRPLRYRCHTGHAFTARTLGSLQSQVTEHAMWSSVLSLKEREVLLRRLAMVARATGDEHQARAGEAEAQRLGAQIKTLVELIEGEIASA